ncbi:MAG: 2-phospho-L-lactate guanylyltransferase, partial [Thermomicrobia bacterium]|nr:2-phospho-L-lactate guanylyltransferase [Thermomicrobia bacterium]
PPSPSAVLAPDYTGSGTNALLLAPPDALPFRFGPNSFARHVAAAEQRSVPYAIARAPGIAGDVDTPDDVRERVGSSR